MKHMGNMGKAAATGLKGWLLTALALVCIISQSACGADGIQSKAGNAEKEDVEAHETARDTGKADHENNTGLKPSWKTLEGGSESAGRPLKQVSNHILQRRYPSVLVLRGPTNVQRVALTFDDGPDQRFTPQVLDVLKKHQVPATFFLIGARVTALPDVTRRIAEEGHAIGNHTYWHPKLWEESADRIRWEATETDRAIREIAGYSPKLFRPPYGGLNDDILKLLSEMNYSVIGWSVDSLDWKQIPADEVESNVLSNMHPGAIILMHSGGHWTQDLSGMIEALDRIIPKLKKEGVEFVTVPELIRVPVSK
jgi:peptidoglycan/xylan/chitin deacetylase (PgdA/CDA1 family)